MGAVEKKPSAGSCAVAPAQLPFCRTTIVPYQNAVQACNGLFKGREPRHCESVCGPVGRYGLRSIHPTSVPLVLVMSAVSCSFSHGT